MPALSLRTSHQQGYRNGGSFLPVAADGCRVKCGAVVNMVDPGTQILLMIRVVIVVGFLFGMAWTVIPAAAFWYASLRFMAARNAKAQLEALPFNSTQAAM